MWAGAAFAAFLVLGLAPVATAADAVRAGDLVIEDAWARASLGSAPNSAAYMTIEVTGDQPDRLLGAATPAAEHAMLHSNSMEGGVVRMRPVEGIEIAPGTPTVLAPGGLHLMLVGLKSKLVEGQTLPLTLTFERAGKVDLEMPIRGLGDSMQRDHGAHQGQRMTN